MMPDPRERPALKIKEAARILEISEPTAYEAARRYLATGGREGLPGVRIGARRLVVPTVLLWELLGLSAERNGLQEAVALDSARSSTASPSCRIDAASERRV